ncbi:MAG: type II toxin-antitoxin system death-on-curing family toxin [Chloroflexota bacterium]
MSLPNDKSQYPLRILSAVDLHNINEEVTNRPSMIRDHQVLQSAVRRPYIILFGQEQFPTLIDKAAATMYSIAAHHVFVDGNKRTAIRATELFLEANGLRPTWTQDEIAPFVLKIARHDIDIEDVATWLSERVEEIDE